MARMMGNSRCAASNRGAHDRRKQAEWQRRFYEDHVWARGKWRKRPRTLIGRLVFWWRYGAWEDA
jgi:hypothetical protein